MHRSRLLQHIDRLSPHRSTIRSLPTIHSPVHPRRLRSCCSTSDPHPPPRTLVSRGGAHASDRDRYAGLRQSSLARRTGSSSAYTPPTAALVRSRPHPIPLFSLHRAALIRCRRACYVAFHRMRTRRAYPRWAERMLHEHSINRLRLFRLGS